MNAYLLWVLIFGGIFALITFIVETIKRNK